MGFKDVIGNSIAASASEGAMEARRKHIRQFDPLYKQLILRSLDTAVFAIPTVRYALDRAAMQRAGYTYVGSGYESRIYSDGDNVIKYVAGSHRMSGLERRALRDQKTADFDQLQAHMSAFVLDQTISVAPHVLRNSTEFVQTVQPYANFTHLMEGNGITGEVKIAHADSVMLDELSDFVDASWRLFGQTGLLPDICGPDNVVQTESSIVLLDTQPVSIENTYSRELTKRQLGSITIFLGRIS